MTICIYAYLKIILDNMRVENTVALYCSVLMCAFDRDLVSEIKYKISSSVSVAPRESR